ncbi:class I SAM-dependent methyltransferase [Myxococcota bacterium]|nr:class I SAM-dependent methyltransferase [Myxococcota bacterium]
MSEEDGRRFWESNAARYDRSMGLLGGPLPRTAELVAAAVSGTARVLEIASGTGLVSEAIAPVVGELLATDYAAAMVEKTRARIGHLPNMRCEVRDLYALGEPEGSFDAVVAANVLHLLPDLPGGLAAMRAVLRPGGRLVVPTYCHAQDARARLVSTVLTLVSFPGRRRFDLATLRVAVEEAGFAVDQAELIPGLLPVGFVAGVVTPT